MQNIIQDSQKNEFMNPENLKILTKWEKNDKIGRKVI